MKLKQLTDEELVKKREDIIDQINHTPWGSKTRRDLYKAFNKIEGELKRR